MMSASPALISKLAQSALKEKKIEIGLTSHVIRDEVILSNNVL
jgi:hypothetical protein